MLRLGFVMNPYAGIGGPAGFKGSDLPELRLKADKGELPLRAAERAVTFWQELLSFQQPYSQHSNAQQSFSVLAAPGSLGADLLLANDIPHETIDYQLSVPSTASDTQASAIALVAASIDLLVFVGGDGTARDLYDAIGDEPLVLGIPSGVKMHSGVYAINPQSGAEVVKLIISGQLITSREQEVRDIDEILFRQGKVKAQYYGQMRVPESAEFVQAVKQGGIENDSLVILDMADYLKESLPSDTLMIWAPGSTTLSVLSEWGHSGTLLGVDVLHPTNGLIADIAGEDLNVLVEAFSGPVVLVVTVIGGQGHVIGRGNQQISTEVLKRVGLEKLKIIASKAKLSTLHGRPLLLDTGDSKLDCAWSGWVPVITGYEDHVLYRLSGGDSFCLDK